MGSPSVKRGFNPRAFSDNADRFGPAPQDGRQWTMTPTGWSPAMSNAGNIAPSGAKAGATGTPTGNRYLTGASETMTLDPYRDARFKTRIGEDRPLDLGYLDPSGKATDQQRAWLGADGYGRGAGQMGTYISDFEDPAFLSANVDLGNLGVRRGTLRAGPRSVEGQLVRYDPATGMVKAELEGFDEARYLADNPDVAQAVGGGQFGSGREHFFRYGQAEGRGATPAEEMAAALADAQSGTPAAASAPEPPGYAEMLAGNLQAVEDALYGRAASRLDPAFAQREDRLRQTLANRGLPLGYQGAGEFTGANAELDQLARDRSDAYNDAIYRAIGGAGAEQSRMIGDVLRVQGQDFSQGLAAAQLANAARAQNFGENQAVRNQQLQELASLFGAQFAPQPTYVNVPGVDVGQYYQMLQNAQMQNAQNAQAGKGGATQLAGNLAAAAILKSSRDWKTDIADAPDALPLLRRLAVLSWVYRHEAETRHVGPMAEDWKDVTGLGDGKTIHLVDAIGLLIKAVQELAARVEILETRHA